MQRPWTVSTLPSSCKQLLLLVETGGDNFIEFVDSGEGGVTGPSRRGRAYNAYHLDRDILDRTWTSGMPAAME